MTIERVPYGKVKTLPEERVYYEKGRLSPVGSLSDWISFIANSKGADKTLRIIDKIMDEDYVISL